MKLYNTLTRKIETIKPIKPNTISLYTCGPTVYDYYHIGNLRNAIFNDTLRRTLEICGFSVKHVMNITDVGHLASDADEGEDKLEKGAVREGKTVQAVADHYTLAFKADMKAINVVSPNGYTSNKYHDNYARATEFIDEQINIVQLLLDKGFAYQTKQAIYFDVTKLPEYGVLSGQSLDDKEIGVRSDVVTDTDKHSPHDFAIWFFAVGRFKNHSMRWLTPWGEGFPGWHLECSAIIHSLLGDPIDIHTGGVDHIGTHHPNEMAQTQAAFGHGLAHIWAHNEFILVDGQKMSKSKGNSYTLADVVKKGFSGMAYRLMVLQAHYRSELNFSWDNLKAANSRLKSLQNFADLKHQTEAKFKSLDGGYFDKLTKEITTELADDLKTPAGLRIISQAIDHIEKYSGGGINPSNTSDFEAFLQFLDGAFGLQLSNRSGLTDGQKAVMAQRQQARDAHNWHLSDSLRDHLAKDNIAVRDTAHGQIWSRI